MRAAAREREKTVSHSQLHSPLTGTLGLGYQDCETSVFPRLGYQVCDLSLKSLFRPSLPSSTGLQCLLRNGGAGLTNGKRCTKAVL